MAQVFTTTAALKALVLQGQEACVPVAGAAGCAGVEIRRELFREDPPELSALSEHIREGKLVSVYSAPVELWDRDGILNKEALSIVIPEALSIGAVWLKTSLGHYRPGESDLAELERYWRCLVPQESALKLTVENDQTPHGGNVGNLRRFFEDCRAAGLSIGMTFDIGNWNWTGEQGLQAADALGSYVVYIHLKHVEQANGSLVTLGLPEAKDSLWRRILGRLPRNVPRTIEFPVEGDDLTGVLRQYTAMIAEA